MESDKKKIQRTLVGCETAKFDIVFITPIGKVFNKICEKLHVKGAVENSFFKTASYVNHQGAYVMIVKIPEGIAAQDIMYVFEDTDVVFLGYAGSLDESLAIGTIVTASAAMDKTNTTYKLYYFENYKKVKCGYSPCFLGRLAVESCLEAEAQGCQIVDMETSYCAKAALENKNRMKTVLVISDIPKTTKFWDIKDEMKKKFEEGVGKAINEIVIYLNTWKK